MGCTAGSSGVRRPPWEVLPSRRPIVQRPRADCEDDPEPGTRTSRKKGLAQGAAIRRHHQAPPNWRRLCRPHPQRGVNAKTLRQGLVAATPHQVDGAPEVALSTPLADANLEIAGTSM